MSDQPSVLIVDSFDENLSAMEALLADIPAQVLVCSTSEDVLYLAREKAPAVILLASKVDEQDGYQILNLLRAQVETKHIPVIFMPASMAEKPMGLHRELLQSVHLLPKPLDTKRLKGMVRFFLRLYRYREAIARLGGEKKKTLIESEEEGVLAIDKQGKIRYANAAAERFLKAKVTDLFGQYIESLLEDETDSITSRWKEHPIAKVTRTEQILQVDNATIWRKDGEQSKIKFAAIPAINIDGISLLIAFRLLKDTREAKDKLKKLSSIDALTGLPSRTRIEEALEVVIRHTKEASQHFAVLFIDLDHFRYINESLGHDHGDQLLKLIAERIRLLIRRDDAIGRMEGDAFVVVLTALDKPHGAASVAAKIIERLHEPFLLNGHEIYTGCSIGIAVFPSCGVDPHTLIKNAETAMGRAKKLGRNNYQFFTSSMNQQRAALLAFEHEIHKAHEEGEFRVEFVPHMDRELKQITALEACLQWPHPRKGLLDVNDFLSVAEDAGMGLDLASFLWKRACADLQLRLAEAPLDKPVKFIVPLLNGLFARTDLADWLIKTISRHGLSPEQILIAVPESSFWLRGHDVENKLNDIQSRGFRFILDHFATGYSSLEMLRAIPYEGVKLSERLIGRVGLSRTDETVVDAAIYLARNLGLKVMANGVTTERQYKFLKSRYCDWIQGPFSEGSAKLPTPDSNEGIGTDKPAGNKTPNS
ncbi:MAG: EAL domain-containing protein [Ketobacteraceae bacterium]|nr:EAL domain-containing protein [Ketobacteraceae bacterium]